MTKEKTLEQSSILSDLFQAGIYKRNQGRVVRQVTFAVIAAGLLLAAWKLWAVARGMSQDSALYFAGVEYVAPGLLLLLGSWIAYRAVNVPRFADFLISVEAEMNKVSWPSRTELIRSSLVVIFMMFFLAIILFGFDLTWQFLFKALNVIRTNEPTT